MSKMTLSEAIIEEEAHKVFPDSQDLLKAISLFKRVFVRMMSDSGPVQAKTVSQPIKSIDNDIDDLKQKRVFSDEDLTSLYAYADSIGRNVVIYPFPYEDKEDVYGRNAAVLADSDWVTFDGINYKEAKQPPHRVTDLNELLNNTSGHVYCARIRDLEKLERLQKRNVKQGTIVPPQPASVVAPVTSPIPISNTNSALHLSKCDSKQQVFLEEVYALTTTTNWVKLTDIRNILIKDVRFAKKTVKAFDSAIATHLEKNGFVERRNVPAEQREIRRIK